MKALAWTLKDVCGRNWSSSKCSMSDEGCSFYAEGLPARTIPELRATSGRLHLGCKSRRSNAFGLLKGIET